MTLGWWLVGGVDGIVGCLAVRGGMREPGIVNVVCVRVSGRTVRYVFVLCCVHTKPTLS